MAGKVNTKFVTIAVLCLLAIMGAGVGLGLLAMKKSGRDHMRIGDEFAAAGDWAKAANSYGAAVFKESTNVQWLKTWLEALKKVTPETQQGYVDAYRTQYMAALKGLAQADLASFESQRQYMEELHYRLEVSGGALAAWEELEGEADETLARFSGAETDRKKLTRYRGIARAQIALAKGTQNEDELKPAYDDLAAALGADPSDLDSIVAKLSLDERAVQRARDAQEGAKADQLQRDLKRQMQEFVAANPPAPEMMVRLYQMEFQEMVRTAPQNIRVSELMQGLKEVVAKTLAAFEQTAPEVADGRLLIGFLNIGVEALADEAKQARQQLDKIAAAQGKNTRFLNAYGQYLLNRGEYEQSIAAMEQIVKLPQPPLSYAGLILYTERIMAIATQSEAVFLMWTQAKTDAEREALVKRIDDYRAALAKLTGEQEPGLLAIDARVKFMKGDLAGARMLISKYNETTDRTEVMSLLLEGQIMQRLGNAGAAEAAYKRALDANPREFRAMNALARMLLQQNRLEDAQPYAVRLSEILPNDEDIKNLREVIDGALSGKEPVLVEIRKAQSLMSGVQGDLGAALKVVEDALKKHGDDPRLLASQVAILSMQGQTDQAKAIIQARLEKFPDDKQFLNLKDALGQSRTMDSMLRQVEEMNLSPGQKAAQKYLLYKDSGDLEKARPFLVEAVKLLPTDPIVTDLDFVAALEEKDEPRIEAIIKRVEEQNIDGLGGLTYRARRSIAKAQTAKTELIELERAKQPIDEAKLKQMRDSLASSLDDLKQASNKDKTNVVTWRLLGTVHLELGDPEAAKLAFAQAITIRPDDISSINGYIKTLGVVGDLESALRFARDKETVAARNEEFRSLWLALESSAPGGDKTRAIKYRTQLAQNEPANIQNLIVLAGLLSTQKQWDDALALVEKIKAGGRAFDAAMIESELRLRKGELEPAVQVVQDYLNSIPDDKKTPQPYVLAARMMRSAGQENIAMQLYSAARAYQDKEMREVDREVADIYYNSGRTKQALDIYIDLRNNAAKDERNLLLARIIEGFMNLGDMKSAQEWLDKAGADATQDATLLILGAKIAAATGDNVKARKLCDQSVALEPKNPATYVTRAGLSMQDPATLRDAEEDFKQALTLSPRFTAARLQLAQIYDQRKDLEGLLRTLREGVIAEPQSTQWRAQLIQVLANTGGVDEAKLVVEQGIKAWPEDIAWLIQSADFMMQTKDFARAVELAKLAFDKRPSLNTAQPYVAILLAQPKPDFAAALKLMNAPELQIAKSVNARLMRAQIYLQHAKPQEALDDVLAAGALLAEENPPEIQSYFDQLQALYPQTKDRMAAIAKLEQARPFQGWLKMFAARNRLEDPALMDSALGDLKAMAASSQDQNITFSIHRILGDHYYRLKQYQPALDSYLEGAKLRPDDAEINNNVAYTMGVDLARPADAIPYAQRAAQAASQSATILDTLGALYIETGKLDDADKLLTQALMFARNDFEKYTVALHGGILRAKQGNLAEAKQVYEDLKKFAAAKPDIAAPHEQMFKRLEELVTK